jgi:hypothetical protein
MEKDYEEEEIIPEGIRRYVTLEDIEICKLNPIKHELIPDIYKNVYAVGNSDRWHCNRKGCKHKGDKWYMMVHLCKPYYRSLIEAKEETKKRDGTTPRPQGSLFP